MTDTSDLYDVLGDRRELSPLEPVMQAIEGASFLDTPARQAAERIREMIPPGAVKDGLSGTWLGHALHPMLTDVVIGAFLGATILDVIGGRRSAAASERLIGVGIAAYAPTAAAGVSDWADSVGPAPQIGRAGLVHATANALALSMYSASLLARRRGRRGRGIALGGAGATLLLAGGYVGGHLSMRRGIGPDQTVFDPGPDEWTPAADAGQLQEGRPVRVVVLDTPILLLRRDGLTFALHDRCSHRGCSLSDGEVDGYELVCPCHGSRFDVRNGAVRRGPATAGQPSFQVRERDDVIEVRRIEPSPG